MADDFTFAEFGKDFEFIDGLMVTPQKRVQIVSEADNLAQALRNRLRTKRGELAWKPNYGSQLHELLGKSITRQTESLAKLYFLMAVSADPRVERVLNVVAVTSVTENLITLMASIEVTRTRKVFNIVYPFVLNEEV